MRERGGDELTADEIGSVFNQCEDLNVLIVCFLGGEPLIRDDILKILHSAAPRRFSKYLTTNGHFITGDVAAALKDARFGSVNVSLHGPADIHDRHCGSKGAFRKTVSGIETLKRHGLPVNIHFVLSRLNADHLDETLKI
ncbi:MAG: radical SAM protein, partial [candidate division NC10 bacterium]|nr:radical SAM protein [candidate division NC10 bacterium]